jgi:hypothetical protein
VCATKRGAVYTWTKGGIQLFSYRAFTTLLFSMENQARDSGGLRRSHRDFSFDGAKEAVKNHL